MGFICFPGGKLDSESGLFGVSLSEADPPGDGLFCGSFLCRGFCLGIGGSFSLGGCSGSFSLLLGYSLGLSLVLSLLCLELSLGSLFLLRSYGCADVADGLLFLSLPGIETTLSFGFVESAFLYASLKMLHEEHTLVAEDCANSVGGLGTDVYPIQSTLEIECYCSRISVRIIRTYPFNKSTISWCPAIGDNNWIERIVFATMTLQSDFCCH